MCVHVVEGCDFRIIIKYFCISADSVKLHLLFIKTAVNVNDVNNTVRHLAVTHKSKKEKGFIYFKLHRLL